MTDLISADVYRLFDVANQKLHVFPFKDVKACWFRLYTDTSIVKAVRKIQEKIGEGRNAFARPPDDSVPRRRKTTERCINDASGWLGDVTAMLDMALIMAGGLGREENDTQYFARAARPGRGHGGKAIGSSTY
jgi:hypothetical protein